MTRISGDSCPWRSGPLRWEVSNRVRGDFILGVVGKVGALVRPPLSGLSISIAGTCTDAKSREFMHVDAIDLHTKCRAILWRVSTPLGEGRTPTYLHALAH
ncbi:unnamed protein product, partial [Pylaiella littoralis]